MKKGAVIGLSGGQSVMENYGHDIFEAITKDTTVRISVNPETYIPAIETTSYKMVVVFTDPGLLATPDVDEDGNVVITYAEGAS